MTDNSPTALLAHQINRKDLTDTRAADMDKVNALAARDPGFAAAVVALAEAVKAFRESRMDFLRAKILAKNDDGYDLETQDAWEAAWATYTNHIVHMQLLCSNPDELHAIIGIAEDLNKDIIRRSERPAA